MKTTQSSPCAWRILTWITLAASALALSGCASGRIAMTPENRGSIHSTRTVLGSKGDEIGAEINQSGVTRATGGGLLPVLIDAAVDSSRTKKANTAVSPIREAMSGFLFEQEFGHHLSLELAQISWLRGRPVDVVALDGKNDVSNIMASTSTGHLLFLESSHALTSDFRAVKIAVKATLYPVEKSGFPKAIYFNELTYQRAHPESEGAHRNHMIDLWAANNGQTLRQYLAEGMNEIAAMLIHDLNDPTSHKFSRSNAIRMEGIHGVVVDDTAQRVWLRQQDGSLYCLMR